MESGCLLSASLFPFIYHPAIVLFPLCVNSGGIVIGEEQPLSSYSLFPNVNRRCLDGRFLPFFFSFSYRYFSSDISSSYTSYLVICLLFYLQDVGIKSAGQPFCHEIGKTLNKISIQPKGKKITAFDKKNNPFWYASPQVVHSKMLFLIKAACNVLVKVKMEIYCSCMRNQTTGIPFMNYYSKNLLSGGWYSAAFKYVRI